jgi:Pyruvate/2-oxoacid:ferredoxin oxidoreductase delta subunit
LNQFESKVPPVNSFYTLLKELYTENEADLASIFPDGRYSVGELADKLNMDKPELSLLVETMADKGHIFVTKADDGEKIYELAPWMPGVIEFSIIRRMDSPKIRTILELTEKMGEETKALVGQVNDLEKLKEMLPDPHVRTMLIDTAIPDKREIFPYEDLLSRIENEQSFAAMRCCCRHMANYREDPCHIEGVPEYSCLGFGKVADFIVDRNFGNRISKEECKEIVKICSEKGLVHNSNNFIEGMQFICNCCGCCCGFIRQVKAFGNLNVINTSNFLSVIDEESCIECGDCEARCPANAISLKDDAAVVDKNVCLGCGNCVPICPSGSISMIRVSEKKPEIGGRKIGLGF